VVARFVWVFARTYVGSIVGFILGRLQTRLMPPTPPRWRYTFVIAFTGVRGAVSLAAALALPFTVPSGDPFPARDLILFIAFGVILITLVGLGLTLPLVVRALGISEVGHDEHLEEHASELAARRDMLAATRASIDAMAKGRQLPEDIVEI